MLQSHNSEMVVLLFIISPFHHNWDYVNEDDFCEAPKDRRWFPGEPTMKRGSELSVPPSDFWGGQRG